MNDQQWKRFFLEAAEVLGEGATAIEVSHSWCSWTTIGRLERDSGYWQAGLPHASELLESAITDGGTWGQPFAYQEIAHLLIPRVFTRELFVGVGPERRLEFVRVEQNLNELSRRLLLQDIPHVIGKVALEVRCL